MGNACRRLAPHLPDDVWREVIRWLGPVDRYHLALASRRMRRLTGSGGEHRMWFNLRVRDTYRALMTTYSHCTVEGFTWTRTWAAECDEPWYDTLSYAAPRRDAERVATSVLAQFGRYTTTAKNTYLHRDLQWYDMWWTRSDLYMQIKYIQDDHHNGTMRWTVAWHACSNEAGVEACAKRILWSAAKQSALVSPPLKIY